MFLTLWMKNKVFAREQKISKEAAPGVTGSGHMWALSLSFSPPCFFLMCANNTRWLRGAELGLFASSVLASTGTHGSRLEVTGQA